LEEGSPMTVSHDLGRTFDVDPFVERQRFGKHGKLRPQLGSPAASQVRAQCERCGAHLLAVPQANGALDGACPVCLSHHLTAVEARHEAA
jgi:hypothetical protein